MGLFKTRKARPGTYMDWDDYEEMITTMELLTWQQATRRQSLRNTLAASS